MQRKVSITQDHQQSTSTGENSNGSITREIHRLIHAKLTRSFTFEYSYSHDLPSATSAVPDLFNTTETTSVQRPFRNNMQCSPQRNLEECIIHIEWVFEKKCSWRAWRFDGWGFHLNASL
jgi:hypothetical protein